MRNFLNAMRGMATDFHQMMLRNARSDFTESFNKTKITSDAIGFLMRFVFLIIVESYVIHEAKSAAGLWFLALAITVVTLAFWIVFFYCQMTFVYSKAVKEFAEFANSGADWSYKENRDRYFSYMRKWEIAAFLIISWILSVVVTGSLFYCAYQFAMAQASRV